MINLFTKKSKRGFTLIELLVVVSIIGLLASIVVVSLGGSRPASRDAKRLADLKQMQNAMELCFNDLVCAGANTNDYPVFSGTCGAIGLILAQAPADPLGATTPYVCRSNASRYCFSAKMEGTSDYTYVSERGTLTGQAAAASSETCAAAVAAACTDAAHQTSQTACHTGASPGHGCTWTASPAACTGPHSS